MRCNSYSAICFSERNLTIAYNANKIHLFYYPGYLRKYSQLSLTILWLKVQEVEYCVFKYLTLGNKPKQI